MAKLFLGRRSGTASARKYLPYWADEVEAASRRGKPWAEQRMVPGYRCNSKRPKSIRYNGGEGAPVSALCIGIILMILPGSYRRKWPPPPSRRR
jgi:hypothetical protein